MRLSGALFNPGAILPAEKERRSTRRHCPERLEDIAKKYA